jgi:hypothetical protein
MSQIEASPTVQSTPSRWTELWRKEDWWAIWLGLGIVAAGLVLFQYGTGLRWLAVLPPRWSSMGQLSQHFAENWLRYVAQFAFWTAAFTAAISTMGFKPREFLPAFTFLYALAVAVFVIGQWEVANFYGFEAPLVALIAGAAIGNLVGLPRSLDAGFASSSTSSSVSY